MEPKTIKIAAGLTVGALVAIVLASGGDELAPLPADAGVAVVEPDAPEAPPRMNPATAREKLDEATAPAATKRALAKLDAEAYNGVIVPLRKADPQLVDFLVALDPGETKVIGANFPKGVRLAVAGGMQASASDATVFTAQGSALDVTWQSAPLVIGVAACQDRETLAWCEMQITNNTAEARRAVFLVRYVMPGGGN